MPWKPGTSADNPSTRNANQQIYDSRRPSSNRRGYSADWTRCRSAFIAKHPLCADCMEEQAEYEKAVIAGRNLPLVMPVVQPTAEVHHIQKVRDRPDLRLTESNLMGLCAVHHTRRTRKGM